MPRREWARPKRRWTETIICPECDKKQKAVVIFDTARDPFPEYVHECRACGYTITESDWNRAPGSRKEPKPWTNRTRICGPKAGARKRCQNCGKKLKPEDRTRRLSVVCNRCRDLAAKRVDFETLLKGDGPSQVVDAAIRMEGRIIR